MPALIAVIVRVAKQSPAGCASAWGLPRRFAPRNDSEPGRCVPRNDSVASLLAMTVNRLIVRLSYVRPIALARTVGGIPPMRGSGYAKPVGR
jgi:hypothetical protein